MCDWQIETVMNFSFQSNEEMTSSKKIETNDEPLNAFNAKNEIDKVEKYPQHTSLAAKILPI